MTLQLDFEIKFPEGPKPSKTQEESKTPAEMDQP